MEKAYCAEKAGVFKFFEEISKIPRGSGNMEKISAYCTEFAEKLSLDAYRDEAGNVIIYKPGTCGYEESEPIILQGHLDMVCQKTADRVIDFENDGLKLYIDGDFLKAEGTTLGADNGIAAAMIMAILAADDIPHPPIEAVFTTDEEIGMIGAGKLDFGKLKAHRMINLDAEEGETVTVSCAGGSDLSVKIPILRTDVFGKRVKIEIKGLKGGHSGVEITGCRTNSNILAGRILHYAKNIGEFNIISIDGGTKGNAIPPECTIELAVKDADGFTKSLGEYFEILKNELADRENAEICAYTFEDGNFSAFDKDSAERMINFLVCTPNGVQEMSGAVSGLAETSLNLGILKTCKESADMLFTLRSNKRSALKFLEDKMILFSSLFGGECEASGHYPPWEFNQNSQLREKYAAVFKEKHGYEPQTEAIHAGLECGVFAANIKDFDCIAIGPQLYDVHTVNERCSISSVKEIFELLCKLLENCK